MSRRIAAAAAVVVISGVVLVLAWAPWRAGGLPAPAVAAGPTTQPDKLPALPADQKAKLQGALDKGGKFLLSAQQPDGSWAGQFGPAITALAVKALVQAGQPIDSTPVKKGLDFIVARQVTEQGNKLHGSFSDQALANYNTAICVSTLVLANRRLAGRPYEQAVKDGLAFLRRDQWDESEGINQKNPAFGGFGYGSGERPDMINTNSTMDALKTLEEAGYLAKDDPMYEKVRVFVQRSQNRTESNDAGTFTVSDDGGFIYTPASSPTKGGAESKGGTVVLPGGKSGLRSVGSTTYAGFKSFIYSGLPKDDPRVRDAFTWIRKNYTLNENPGIGADGLFYYYHIVARALNAWGEPIIRDAANVPHDWRAELIDRLASLQRSDGSWVNDKAERWEEGNPVLASCFAMLALEEVAAGAK